MQFRFKNFLRLGFATVIAGPIVMATQIIKENPDVFVSWANAKTALQNYMKKETHAFEQGEEQGRRILRALGLPSKPEP
jgi:hypothetical protein